MEWHAEHLRLFLVGDGRLDRLRAARDLDLVPLHEEIVERVLLEVLERQAGHERGARVEDLDRHRLTVREPQATGRDDRLGRRDVEDPAEPRAGRHHGEAEGLAGGCQTAAAHVVAERGDVHALRDLGLRDEGPRATPAHEVSLAHEPFESRAHRQPRDTEVETELALGGDRRADLEAVDQLQHLVPRLALLGQCATSSGTPSAASREPVWGSKKWNRRVSTASSTTSPTRAVVRGSTRAANRAWVAGKPPPTAVSSASAVTGGASTVKKMCASEPSSSSTSTRAEIVGTRRATAASSKSSGRSPTTTRSRPAGGRFSGESGTRYCPKHASSPSIVASTRFIAGEPMNAAMNRSSGRSYRSLGRAICWIRPSRITATRWPSVIASVWSCVT